MKKLCVLALLLVANVAFADTTGCLPGVPCQVPEPSTLLLMGVGLLAGLGFLRKK